MTSPSYDDDGKISLDHVYNTHDPRAYFQALRQLDYRVPQEAKPVFRDLIAARQETGTAGPTKLVDIGCSYGINAALLKHDLSLEDLYRLYVDEAPGTHAGLRARDAGLFAGSADDALEMVGVDVASRAVAYAVDAGLLEGGIPRSIEDEPLAPHEEIMIANTDLIISTGCVGYVTNASLDRLVEPNLDNGVWMANFVLRMFDYEPVAAAMDGHGYVTERLDGVLFPQRRFATAEEKGHVLDNLAGRGITPDGAEADGWYYAELHVSRPKHVAERMPLEAVLKASALPAMT